MGLPWNKLSRWDRALLALAVLYLLLWPLEAAFAAAHAARIALRVAIFLAGSVVLVRLAIRGIRALTARFLWRVRHRMAAVYVFVGVIPVLLVLALAVFGTYLTLGPLAAYMVASRIEQRSASLQATAAAFGWKLRSVEVAERRAAAEEFLREVSPVFPGIMVRVETPAGPVGYPPWLLEGGLPPAIRNFQGVVRRQGQLFLAAQAQYEADGQSILFLVPLTETFLDSLLPALGPVEVLEAVLNPANQFRPEPAAANPPAAPGAGSDGGGEPSGGAAERERLSQGVRDARAFNSRTRSLAERLPPPAHPFDWRLPWVAPAQILSWSSGSIARADAFVLYTRPSAVWRVLSSNQSQGLNEVLDFLSAALRIAFGVLLAISVVVAVSLTRTLTRAIHELYVGTQLVNQGDLAYRTPVRGDDQLAELSRSFNTMTESIARLIVDSRERQRLESELAIAREVQAQMFPRAVPKLPGLELCGVCRPARAVSGDFYDFVQLGPGRVAFALGDVSGKGISAALVMANLHSIVRTQLSLLRPADGGGEIVFSTSELVSRTNRQLVACTAPEKFATFFFANYDDRSGALAYCNAGHLPPLLVRRGKARRLDVNGLIVGIMAEAPYNSSLLQLEPGDLLVAFTDGISEPENAYDQEFGEDRLIEIVIRESVRPAHEIIEIVMEEVVAWTGAGELQDDMTMLVARRNA